jgi:hypothetical protein
MSNRYTFVAGGKTDVDWVNFRPSLVACADASVWKSAFEDFFHPRLTLRYLEPIKLLQDKGTSHGEGFSITAIQCTLVEFLESTRTGQNYQYLEKGHKLGPNEYSSSQRIFVNFLINREPFLNTFDEASAVDFYAGVRCGLLHEAQTKNGWKIRAKGPDDIVADIKERIFYRDNFQSALLEYVELYKGDLLLDAALQSAFIRKFDNLCRFEP